MCYLIGLLHCHQRATEPEKEMLKKNLEKKKKNRRRRQLQLVPIKDLSDFYFISFLFLL